MFSDKSAMFWRNLQREKVSDWINHNYPKTHFSRFQLPCNWQITRCGRGRQFQWELEQWQSRQQCAGWFHRLVEELPNARPHTANYWSLPPTRDKLWLFQRIGGCGKGKERKATLYAPHFSKLSVNLRQSTAGILDSIKFQQSNVWREHNSVKMLPCLPLISQVGPLFETKTLT